MRPYCDSCGVDVQDAELFYVSRDRWLCGKCGGSAMTGALQRSNCSICKKPFDTEDGGVRLLEHELMHEACYRNATSEAMDAVVRNVRDSLSSADETLSETEKRDAALGHMMSIFHEIRAERARQDEKWGGAEHDDLHGEDEWALFIGSRAWEVVIDNDVARRIWVEVAALAVAAIESHDRKNRRVVPEEDEKS